jgi:hypothetical protein
MDLGERAVPVAHGEGSTPVRVYIDDEHRQIAALTFGRPGGALAASLWTTVDGLETVRDMIDLALAQARQEGLGNA